MEYLTDIPALAYHAESVKLDDGTWIKDNIANSFDEAVTIINDKAVAYAEQAAEIRKANHLPSTSPLKVRSPKPNALRRSRQEAQVTEELVAKSA